ncbi:hypothetical protein I4U23_022126 [Adineta vaga]|nr:hypothetical protein I4U23_022126 [Adineta vaga]
MAIENRRSLYIASALLLVCGILYIVANALPMWGKITYGSLSNEIGLWRACAKGSIDNSAASKCGTFNANASDMKSNIMAARAFVTISCILWALAILSILSILFLDESLKSHISSAAKGLAIACLISGIIGVALGIHFAMEELNQLADAANLKDIRSKMNVSSILAIIALVFNLAGAVATFFIK